MNRRDFGRTGIAVSVGGVAGCNKNAEKPVEIQKTAQKTPKPYGIQYYEKARGIWDRISTSELPLIVLAADKAASSHKNGGKLYCQLTGGHMQAAEFRPDRRGNPNYLHNWSRLVEEKEFDAIGKGDFLLFDYPKEQIKRARDRGAFSVGIRVPYFPNETTPKGVLAMGELAVNPIFDGILPPEECADIMLTSGTPFTDGVLYIPEIPAVRVCPISPQGTHNFYWMLTAEIAMRDKGGGAMGSSEKADEYIELIKQRGAKIRANIDTIDAVAKAMVEYVSQGARYWNFPLSTSPGKVKGPVDMAVNDIRHGARWAIMVTENTNRASGLVMSHLITPEEIKEKGKAGDFVFIASEASDVKGNYEAAQAFKNAGFKVIYIGPADTEGSSGDFSSGNDLPKIADWHIDTFSPESEGVLTVPGFDRKLCPTTGVLYPLVQYMLNAQFIGHMIKAGKTPLVFMGLHIIGGGVYYDLVKQIFETRELGHLIRKGEKE